jgi:hypothetical protein
VLASASRIYNEEIGNHSYSFITKSPAKTTNVMRILLPAKPKRISAMDAEGNEVADLKSSWDNLGKTSFLSFENSPDGIKVVLGW